APLGHLRGDLCDPRPDRWARSASATTLRRVTRPLPLAAAALVLALAACGGSSDDAPATTTTGATSADDTPPPAQQAQRRRLRLVSIGSFDSPLYVTAP